MKKLNFILLVLVINLGFNTNAQKNTYTPKNFGTLYDFFEYKKDLLKFFDIKSGEVIGSIGASSGYHEAAMSTLYDSLTFYIEDTKAKDLAPRKFNRTIKKYTSFRKSKETNKFIPVLGTYTKTNLPNASCDKIIMIASFHEYSEMDSTMIDIASKLKPSGKLYVMEAFCIDKIIHCEDNHNGYYMKQVDSIMAKIGFYRTQMNSPESYIHNYANILVYEKNKNKSEIFSSNKKQVQELLNKTFLFDNKAIASDTLRLKSITDSIQTQINQLQNVYNTYEVFVKNIGAKWTNKKEFNCAINILKCAVLKVNPAEIY